MKLSFIEKQGLMVAVIDDFYGSDSLNNIKDELLFLNNPRVFNIYANKFAAVDDDGKPRQKSNSLFLDDFFIKNREASSILQENRLLFSDALQTQLLEKSAFFGHVTKCTEDITLLNFYSVGEYYNEHIDKSSLTALTFFTFGEVLGGEFNLTKYDVSIPCVDNRVVIFPGCVDHSSSPVISGVKISMAQFLGY